MTEAFLPGQRIRMNGKSPWPARRGCEGVVVDPAIFGGVYPAPKGRVPDDEVIILLDDDPLRRAGASWDDPRWSCCVEVTDLEPVVTAPPPHPEPT